MSVMPGSKNILHQMVERRDDVNGGTRITDSIHRLHEVIWGYIGRWKSDPTGPWWEADLSMDIGRALVEKFGDEERTEVANGPSFLQAWPPVHFRRLGTNNHFKRTPKRGSLYPDYFYRKERTDDCEWIAELKLWSVDGNMPEDKQVKGAFESFKADANKWIEEETYPFSLLAVNIPLHFKLVGRARQAYKPEDFANKLTDEVKGWLGFQALDTQGAGVVVIKSIESGNAELFACVATPRFAESPFRPADIPCR